MVANKIQQEKKSNEDQKRDAAIETPELNHLSVEEAEEIKPKSDEIEIEILDAAAEQAEPTEMESEKEVERDETGLKQAKEYLAHLQMLQAEFQNYKKRIEKERLELGKYVKAEFIRRLLPVIDDFDRFIENHAYSEVIEGFRLIHDKLLNLLKGEGLEQITAKGQPFDPNIHEALFTQEVATEEEDGKVLEEWEKGFYFQGNLLRASKVKVGKLKSE